MTDPKIRHMSFEELQTIVGDYPEIDADSLDVYNQLTQTSRLLVAEIDRAASERPHGQSAGRNNVLWAIIRYPGKEGITPAEIADALSITRASVTGLLTGLEQEGLVTRMHSREDRRRIHVRATQKAQDYVREEWPVSSADISLVFKELSDREKTQAINILRKIRQGIRNLKSSKS